MSLRAPVYLLGTQGGGLTLLSRILHRHPDAISVSSHHRHWAGEDETQNALAPILTRRFRLAADRTSRATRSNSMTGFMPTMIPAVFPAPWATDADPAAAARYRGAPEGGGCGKNGLPGHPAPRFIDKSQSLTVRVGFLQARSRTVIPASC